jgi:hypothetical protein
MARLADVIADPQSPSEVFRLLTADEPQKLSAIAKLWAVPKGRFVEWFTTTHADLYDAALKVLAADLALDALQAALDATPEDVSVRKLQADISLRLASKFDRARYGETVRVEKGVTFTADAGLLGTMGALLKLVSSGVAQERLVGEGAAEEVSKAPALAVVESGFVI